MDNQPSSALRFVGGRLVTHADSKIQNARIAPYGRVHRVTHVILRWNFMGGTHNKPDMTFVMACGPQRRHIHPVPVVDPCDMCARCDTSGRGRA